MKKLFSLLTLALLTTSVWAETSVTFDLTTGFEDQQELTTIEQDGITLTFDKGTSSTTPKWYNNGKAARLYAKNTLNIASDGDEITEVVFTFTGTGNTMNNNGTCSVDEGTYVENGTTGTWTGEAESFTITRGGSSGHARIATIVVTMGGQVVTIVADPVFTPADGATFNDTQEISLACATGGATISYSTDGLAWTTYNEPFTIRETTTVYAKAALNGVESNTVSATYTKLEPVSGTCITFKSSEDPGTGTATQNPWYVTKDGVTLDCTKGWVDSASYRIYQGETLTITSTVGNIVKIEFDGLNNYPISRLTADTGTLTTNGNNGTWIGEETEIVFTATAQTRASEIRVYVDNDQPIVVVAAPTLPAACTFEDSYTVNITNNEDGATLYYSTDNQNWTEGSSLTITETTTVYAKAVKGDNESATVHATYTKVEPTPGYNTLAQVNVLATDTEFEFTGDAVVTVQRGSYLWLRDATGYGLIYGNINGSSDVTFAPGTVLSQNWTAKTKIFNGLMEYVSATNVAASGNTNAALAAIQEITALDTTMVNAYVQVKNVKSFVANGKNVTATLMDGTTMVMYNQFSETIPAEEGNYTVEGVVSTHNALQLMILSIEGFVPETYSVNNIAEALELADNSTFTMYNDCVATYQNGNRLWIRDTQGNSGLIYGTIEATFNNGDVLSDGWTAKKTVYNNVPEFIEPEDISASGDTSNADPFEVAAFTNDNVNEYVILKGITVLTDEGNAKRFYNAADSTVLFNTFNLTLPTVEDGKTYDVTGIVTIYYGKPQLYITDMTEVANAGIRGDVNDDGFVNISDVTDLINYLLTDNAEGINLLNANCNGDETINISDVTDLINFLLTDNWAD